VYLVHAAAPPVDRVQVARPEAGHDPENDPGLDVLHVNNRYFRVRIRSDHSGNDVPGQSVELQTHTEHHQQGLLACLR